MRTLAGRLALAALCASFGCGPGEVEESFYISLQNAFDDGAISRGWVPSFLPPSAASIHEVHDASGGTALLFFTFAPGEPGALVGPCQAVSESDVPPPPEGLGRTRWWPRDLLGNARGGLRLFRCEDHASGRTRTGWLAVDVARGLGYHWRTAE